MSRAKCPHCGESYGFVVRVRCTHVQVVPYDLDPFGHDCTVIRERNPKRAACADCGKDITEFVRSLGLEGWGLDGS